MTADTQKLPATTLRPGLNFMVAQPSLRDLLKKHEGQNSKLPHQGLEQ